MIEERYHLAKERIVQIEKEEAVAEPFRSYFRKAAGWILLLDEWKNLWESGKAKELSLEELETWNQRLYGELLPGQYETSYANPEFAVLRLGHAYGQPLCFLYSELRGGIAYASEQKLEYLDILMELFLEIYHLFEEGEPSLPHIKDCIYWYASDYCDVFLADHIKRQVDPGEDFLTKFVQQSDLQDPRYLYRTGEYVGENERASAKYLASLPKEEIERMAVSFVEGYERGFENTGKDLSKKNAVNIRYTLGFERVIKRAIEEFEKKGLRPVIYRGGSSVLTRPGGRRLGFVGGEPSEQYLYDHKNDQGLFLDGRFMERKLEVIQNTYESVKEQASRMAGPACMETFGEKPFAPRQKQEAVQLTKKQENLVKEMAAKQGAIVNRYIKGEERSYTIVAYPVREIGEDYEEIFREIIGINTLDAEVYTKVQKKLIDRLDTGRYVRITGRGKNETDLVVQLYKLKDPERETIFENCVADVNVPAGEVFTSPVLEKTEGLLHVTKVYLNGLLYLDLKLRFRDGMITDYSCGNFETEEENRKYVFENILHCYPTLPMGEFAIGTNTAAYALSQAYGIEDKLPILIAEKMGPHFAVGDTCYTWSEDIPVFNPDGKEIVARDNEISLKRKEDPGKAYFQCHTDITIPYGELGDITVCGTTGETFLIRDGKFVLEGTEFLNEPLKNTYK